MKHRLNEGCTSKKKHLRSFREDWDDFGNEWEEIDSKQVQDSDGFWTDYTWYSNGEKHIFMFGDKELYEPDEDYADWETEDEETAQIWFNTYEGFTDDDEIEETEEEEVIDENLNESILDKGLKANVNGVECNTVEAVTKEVINSIKQYRFHNGDDSINITVG